LKKSARTSVGALFYWLERRLASPPLDDFDCERKIEKAVDERCAACRAYGVDAFERGVF
jgi:hypothetical protein